MNVETLCTPFTKTHETLATDTSFPSRIPKVTRPSGDGVIELGENAAKTGTSLLMLFGGTGQDDAVLTGARILGWSKVKATSPSLRDLWVPVKLAEFAGVCGSAVGIAATPVLNTFFFCDTLTLVSGQGNANVSHELVSPADNTIAHALLSVKGFELIEVTFDLGANMTGAGCLYKKL